MVTLRRRSPVLLVCGLVFVSILLGLINPSPAQADVGVQPILPGGSNILPDVQTPIQMAAEVVTMNVRRATEADNDSIQLNPDAYGLGFQSVWYSYVAEVQGDFTMNNPTADPISMTVWFPLASTLETVTWELNPDEIVPRIASFDVQADGIPLEIIVSELTNPKGTDKPALPWASFPVNFPAGADTKIQVSYLLPLQYGIKSRNLALFYIFQTGAGWDGSIGQAELVLNLPYPASSDTLARVPIDKMSLPYGMPDPEALIPLEAELDGNQARWTWTDFEPTSKDDFSVWLLDPNGWNEAENLRTIVQQNPDNGQAWLNLASDYYSFATAVYNAPSIFFSSYQSLGLEAYQTAADLLPDHPAPHTGLALLTLSPFMRHTDAPPDVLQYVQDELRVARELEADHPELVQPYYFAADWVDEILYTYFGNATQAAQQTSDAASTMIPAASATLEPTISLTSIPSSSSIPALSKTITPEVIQPEELVSTNPAVVRTVLITCVVILILTFFAWLSAHLSRPPT